MTIAVVDYDAGNIRSLENALRYLGARYRVTSDADTVAAADRIIIPGDGEARTAMGVLHERGLDGALRAALGRGVPMLGICIGAQIVLDRSEERDAECLGFVPGVARRLPGGSLKVPHMGWNTIEPTADHPILAGVAAGSSFYFVHSYAPDVAPTHALAVTEYGRRFASIVANGSVVATQFHPEKSGRVGLALVANFLAWNP